MLVYFNWSLYFISWHMLMLLHSPQFSNLLYFTQAIPKALTPSQPHFKYNQPHSERQRKGLTQYFSRLCLWKYGEDNSC